MEEGGEEVIEKRGVGETRAEEMGRREGEGGEEISGAGEGRVEGKKKGRREGKWNRRERVEGKRS